jgi:hypothetical protein
VRAVLALLLLWPLALFAVDRDLDDCTIPGSHVYAEATPFDLDWCTFVDGDDITAILVGAADAQGASVYIRAPSGDRDAASATIDWKDDPTVEVTTFVFLEDQDSSSRFLVQHKNAPTDAKTFYRLWNFVNSNVVRIGSGNLAITFRGNHPGLGNCRIDHYPTYNATSNCDGMPGLLHFATTNSTQPDLIDVRANVAFAQGSSIRIDGAQANGAVANRVKQVNVAGLHYATSGFYINGGVQKVWMDPDRFWQSDPYLRTHGWDGAIARTEGGYSLGCFDELRTMPRGDGAATVYVDELTGGVTFEYGTPVANQRAIGKIGSAAQPFILRIKDWGSSGPGTTYPAGVRSKRSHQPILFKGDPAEDLGYEPARFVRMIKLPDDYGSGVYGGSIADGLCAAGNETDNFYQSGTYNVMRLEANSSSNVKHGYKVEFAGDWDTNFWRGVLFLFHYAPTNSTNRSWQHILKASAGTTISDTITMHDTNTVTGPGTFTNVTTADMTAVDASVLQAGDNTVTDTNIAGVLAVAADTGTVTVDNVNFTGSARAVITVASGSAAVVTDLCVPDGSTITGAGTLTYEGSGESLPFTIPDSTANCAITADPRPGAVTGGGVN